MSGLNCVVSLLPLRTLHETEPPSSGESRLQGPPRGTAGRLGELGELDADLSCPAGPEDQYQTRRRWT